MKDRTIGAAPSSPARAGRSRTHTQSQAAPATPTLTSPGGRGADGVRRDPGPPEGSIRASVRDALMAITAQQQRADEEEAVHGMQERAGVLAAEGAVGVVPVSGTLTISTSIPHPLLFFLSSHNVA